MAAHSSAPPALVKEDDSGGADEAMFRSRPMSPVSYATRDAIALVHMDDGKANALGYDMMDALDDALTRAEREASAVVLHGRPGRFSAGFDLKQMMAGADSARALLTRGSALLMRLYGLPMPLVIACTGHALAGGALMLLTGDIRIATRGAFKIGLNEVQIGMPVPILAMELARDRLDPRHLTPSTLFATVCDPDEAKAAGWVDRVESDVSILECALEQATKLVALPRDPYAKTKLALREKTIRYVNETLESDMKRLTPLST
jgi:enoyl-CoA hydratase